ncbi:hypothetical protein Agabi119p4_134 [Agaricus bisporus var. burnettii]|uniref:Uncharacterized protein n=1 Tax=Agaricus bisporus var. burnettii TaxID=192524 RepID=A0A8H7KKV2_AGABI|nr:hypothetical protein Agabi119p4_134 [Agaricus bisporus var. burnettii]
MERNIQVTICNAVRKQRMEEFHKDLRDYWRWRRAAFNDQSQDSGLPPAYVSTHSDPLPKIASQLNELPRQDCDLIQQLKSMDAHWYAYGSALEHKLL